MPRPLVCHKSMTVTLVIGMAITSRVCGVKHVFSRPAYPNFVNSLQALTGGFAIRMASGGKTTVLAPQPVGLCLARPAPERVAERSIDASCRQDHDSRSMFRLLSYSTGEMNMSSNTRNVVIGVVVVVVIVLIGYAAGWFGGTKEASAPPATTTTEQQPAPAQPATPEQGTTTTQPSTTTTTTQPSTTTTQP
jgi:hypothetical protein